MSYARRMLKRPRMTMPTLMVLQGFLDAPCPLSGANFFNSMRIWSGTLYPILARLERLGWLSSHWEDIDPSEAGRPRRRFYTLTDAGRAEAENVMAELRGDQ